VKVVPCHQKRFEGNSVRAVLFDFGDTIVLLENFDYDACLRKLYECLVRNGVAISYDTFKQAYFETRDRLYKETEETLEEPHFHLRVSRTLEKLGYNIRPTDRLVTKASEAFAYQFVKYLQMEESVPEILEALGRMYKLGLISNFALPQGVWKALEKFGLNKFFDVIVVSGDLGFRKPHPKIFETALKTLNVKPSNALFVGDSLSTDVKGAKDVGMKSILLKRKSIEDTVDIHPDRIISSLGEVLGAIKLCLS